MPSLLHKVKSKIKFASNDLLYTSGIRKNNPKKYRNEAIILLYHGIDQRGEIAYNSRFISRNYFEKQVAYFAKHFNPISLDQFYAKDYDKNKLNVCLTFDDGYRNNLKYAIPILEKYKVPATFFVTAIRKLKSDILWADYIDLASANYSASITIANEQFEKRNAKEYYSTTNGVSLKAKGLTTNYQWKQESMSQLPDAFKKQTQFADYWELLSDDEIAQIDRHDLFSVGAHGTVHDSLANIDFEAAQKDILDSKEYLESIVQREVTAMAYPFGHYNKDIVDYCNSIGLKQQLLMDFANPNDKSKTALRNRFGMNPYISWNNQLRCLLNGSYV